MKILHNMTTSEGLIDNICILVSKSKNKIKKDSWNDPAILISVCLNILIFLNLLKTKIQINVSNYFSRTKKQRTYTCITVLPTLFLGFNTVRNFQKSNHLIYDWWLFIVFHSRWSAAMRLETALYQKASVKWIAYQFPRQITLSLFRDLWLWAELHHVGVYDIWCYKCYVTLESCKST